MMFLTILTVLFQFTGFEYRLGGIRLDAFSVVVPLMCVVLVAQLLARKTIRVPTGLLLLVPFALVHILSALGVSTSNGVREGLQMAVVFAFLLAVCNIKDPCPRGWLWRFLVLGTCALLIYNVVWHINEGYLSGWKRLDDLKHTLLFATFFVAVWFAQRRFRAHTPLVVLFGILGGIILISGERKALLLYVIAFASMMSVINLRTAVIMLVAPLIIGALTLSVFMDEYVSRQIDSLFLSADYTPDGKPTSMSNEQRTFAFETGTQLFSQSPIVGIGTNSYEDVIERLYPFHPAYLRTSIHGDFFRVLVENGLVGFIAYLSVWILAIVRTWRFAAIIGKSELVGAIALTRQQYLFVSFQFLILALALCGLESSGTRSLVLLGLVSMWPDLSRIAVLQKLASSVVDTKNAVETVPR